MKICVQRNDGRIEILELANTTWELIEGPYLNRLHSSSGMDHFFDKEGFYDGWGAALGGIDGPIDVYSAVDIINAMEEKREIKEPHE